MTRLSVRPGGGAATAASAVLRAAAAVLAGAALTAGLSLVLWAVTPNASAEASVAVTSGVVAFAAAHFLPVAIGGTAVTLTPLLLTAIMIAVITTAVGRGRPVHGRLLESLHAGVFVVAYAAGVDLFVAFAAPPGSVQVGLGAPVTVAAVGAALSLVRGAAGWRAWWAASRPTWIRQTAVATAGTVCALVFLAAGVLAVAVAATFPDALRVAQLTVHSAGDAFGMTLLGLAFVPNAVIAAIGYVSGAGFAVGDASYSPLAVHAADLPGVPLLAAVPGGAPGLVAGLSLAAPILAALSGAWMLRKVGDTRWQRLAACAVTALAVGAITAGLVAAGRGGIAGGPWSAMGAAPLLVGGLIAGTTVLITGATVVPAGWRALSWRTKDDVFLGASAAVESPESVQAAKSEPAASVLESASESTDPAPRDDEDFVILESDGAFDTPPNDPLAESMDAPDAEGPTPAEDASEGTSGAEADGDSDESAGLAQAG